MRWSGWLVLAMVGLGACAEPEPTVELPTGCVPLETYVYLVPQSCDDRETCERWSVQTGLGAGWCNEGSCQPLPPCEPEGDDDDSAAGPATWTEVQQRTLIFDCQPCHTINNQGGLRNLHRFDLGHTQLVSRESMQVEGMSLVEPGDVAMSYLMHKLRGTHLEVGGEDEIMPPPGRPPLSEDALRRLEAWILDGAPKN